MKKTKINTIISMIAVVGMTTSMLASCGAGSDNSHNKSYGNNNVKENTIAENIIYDEQEEDTIKNEVSDEQYAAIIENDFVSVKDAPLSTFSTDVDTASYTNIRRMINYGEPVDPDAVRTEEFINYFDYDYTAPTDTPVGITTELSDCPWNDKAKLMLVGLQAQKPEVNDIATNLVFLIDVSGSMMDDDKLPLVQQAFSMLTESLDSRDRISIVTYAGSDEVVLAGETGNNHEEILDAINSLEAGGSTYGEAGINQAYKLAEDNFIEGGNNRVILATDGDLNVGVSSADGLTRLIEEKRDSGVFLSVLGFGTGNLNDENLEALADHGNGNYAYIDSDDEARRVLVTELNGTLYTVAKDTKIQVEFNPSNVAQYRLVGYENRLLNDEDFADDTKDAGDIGAGQQVTALYEIITTEDFEDKTTSNLKYQRDTSSEEEISADDNDLDKELLTISLRYKEPDRDTSEEISAVVKNSSYTKKPPLNLSFAACVAEFSMILRGSKYIGSITCNDISSTLEENGLDNDEKREEFAGLVKTYYSQQGGY